MRFTILGPLQAWRGDVEVELGPPTRRTLLGFLLASGGRPVTVGEIITVLWGDNPPNTAANIVHRHVGALRRLLNDERSPEPGAVRLRNSGGYRVTVNADTLDLLRFREITRLAAHAESAGSPAQAVRLFVDALSLWRGPTGAGLLRTAHLHPAFITADRERIAATMRAAELALGAGIPDLVLPAIQQAAGHHPLDEALHAKLILVLAASGRQAEALDTFQRVRSRLAEELGVDPGTQLRQAHQCVLRQQNGSPPAGACATEDGQDGNDPSAMTQPAPATPTTPTASTALPTAPAPSPATTSTPAQLPADLSALTGRHAELHKAREALAAYETGEPPANPEVIAICGMPGVGKTAFAVHLAHQVAHLFPDGQLYLDLRGFGPAGEVMSADEALRALLDSLGVAPNRFPMTREGRMARYRSLLAGRRILVVLDNARDSEQVRPLLPATPGCAAIVTSRDQLRGLTATGNARLLTLGVLTADEARENLARRLGADRIAAEPRAVDQLIELCGRLPLTLAVVAARAATYPGFPLSSIADELRESNDLLDAFATTDPLTDARTVLSWSYRAISPAAARLFVLLATHLEPIVSALTAARLAVLPVSRVRVHLDELTSAHLVEQPAPGQYACHELMRAYARELKAVQQTEDAERRRA